MGFEENLERPPRPDWREGERDEMPNQLAVKKQVLGFLGPDD